MEPTRIYEYLTTARAHVFDRVRSLTREQYRQEHPIGLASIARTLHHMKGAEWQYVQRLKGVTGPLGPVAPENDAEVTDGEPLEAGALERSWVAQAERTRAALVAVDDWSTPRVYTTMWEGKPYVYRASPADIFAQLAFHEVHHRAQVMHMLGVLGVGVGEIDYNTLMWEHIATP